MVCPKCGKDLCFGSNYCGYCGNSVLSINEQRSLYDDKRGDASFVNKRALDNLLVFRVTLGIVFIVASILLFVIHADFSEGYSQIGQYSSEDQMTYSITLHRLNFINNLFDPFLMLFPATVSFIAGASLLMNKKGAFKLSFITAVIHIVSVLLNVVLIVLLYAIPHIFIGLFDDNVYRINAVVTLLRTNDYFISESLITIISRIIVLSLTTVFVFVFRYYIKKQKGSGTLYEKVDTSLKGLVLLAIFLSVYRILLIFKGIVYSPVMLSTGGVYSVSAYSNSTFVVSENAVAPDWVMLFVFIAVCMIFYKARYKIIAPITVGIILIVGLFKWLFSLQMIGEMNMSEEIYDIFHSIYPINYALYILEYVALFLLIAAIVKKYLPIWLEIVLFITVTLLYVLFELIIVEFLMLHFDWPIFIGDISYIVLIAVTAVVSSVVVSVRNRRKAVIQNS